MTWSNKREGQNKKQLTKFLFALSLIQYLNSDQTETACHNEPSASSSNSNNNRHATHHKQQPHLHPQRPLVLCCQDDLCNYSAQQVELRFNSAFKGRNESNGKQQQQQQLTYLSVFFCFVGPCFFLLHLIAIRHVCSRRRIYDSRLTCCLCRAAIIFF